MPTYPNARLHYIVINVPTRAVVRSDVLYALHIPRYSWSLLRGAAGPIRLLITHGVGYEAHTDRPPLLASFRFLIDK